MVINGWKILYYKVFQQCLRELAQEVVRLKNQDPEGYKQHPKTKLLAYVNKTVKEIVPADPFDRQFLLGNTLGREYRHWRRAKSSLPPRYRLFFQVDSEKKSIIYVWLNSESTLRKAGAKTDVYAVFQHKLDSHEIPDNFAGLANESKEPSS